jgi:hypothetical protein
MHRAYIVKICALFFGVDYRRGRLDNFLTAETASNGFGYAVRFRSGLVAALRVIKRRMLDVTDASRATNRRNTKPGEAIDDIHFVKEEAIWYDENTRLLCSLRHLL